MPNMPRDNFSRELGKGKVTLACLRTSLLLPGLQLHGHRTSNKLRGCLQAAPTLHTARVGSPTYPSNARDPTSTASIPAATPSARYSCCSGFETSAEETTRLAKLRMNISLDVGSYNAFRERHAGQTTTSHRVLKYSGSVVGFHLWLQLSTNLRWRSGGITPTMLTLRSSTSHCNLYQNSR